MSINHCELRSNHSPQSASFTEKDVREGTLRAWAEIAVLVDSDCLVMSSSMFSFLAYYIRGETQCAVRVNDRSIDFVTKRIVPYDYESGDWMKYTGTEIGAKALAKRKADATGSRRQTRKCTPSSGGAQ